LTFALGINAQGDIVGGYTASGVSHAYLLRHGTFTTFDVPSGTATTATGINPKGDIVGNFVANGATRGFLAQR